MSQMLTSPSPRMYHRPHPLPPSTNPFSALTSLPSTDRSKRVKDAKNEAQKEIEDYRKQKDDEFKEFEKKVGSMSKFSICIRH